MSGMFTGACNYKWLQRQEEAGCRSVILYLCTVLGLGHSYQQLENGLGLRHQRGDGVDDRCELGVWFNTWKITGRLINTVYWTVVLHM